MDLSQITEMTEAEARTFLELVRWPHGPVCPHCGNKKAYRLEGEKTPPGTWKCSACRKKFTVTVDTVMHRSHIPLRKWVMAFHLMSSSKKGISALQLQRNLGIKNYKNAWHLAHRVRAAMTEGLVPLKGTVEVDETYVGGKPRKENKGGSGNPYAEPKKNKRGRGTSKTPVLALVERNGNVYSKPIEHVDAKTLKGAIKETVHKDSTIMTDEWASYEGIGKDFSGGHETVKHNDGEFARGDVWTNSAESYFALLKRGVHGSFHHVSKQHLYRYCNEFSFRWNRRKIDDGERTICIIQGVGGKRLTYKPLCG
ncbi:MAG: IS1595 family transposase [Pseudomonadota bacterium]